MKRRLLKVVSVFMALNLLAEIFFPTAVYALSGGPSQPEVQSFEPVGTTEMVNLSSGDFTYNIPLLDVEGYPINISYHSGITMDQEATWVGLGWNINPGVVNRNMRGLPDDFRGDEIKKEMYVKPNTTFGASFGADFELFGFKKPGKKITGRLGASLGVFYNNYKGIGFEQKLSPSISAGNKVKSRFGIAISGNTQSGMNISPSLGLTLSSMSSKAESKNITGYSFSVGSSYNSRTGTKALTFSKGISISRKAVSENSLSTNNGGSVVSYNAETYVPQINMPMTAVNISLGGKFGTSAFGVTGSYTVDGYFSSQYISEDYQTTKKGAYGYLYAQDVTGDVLQDINREKDGGYSKHNPNLPVTNFTYDVYSVSGQGIGGVMRPHRSEIGHVYDDNSESHSYGGNGGAEWGMGNLVKWGADAGYNHSSSKSGRWEDGEGNELATVFNFKKKSDVGYPFYEPAYFKSAGEKTKVEESYLPYQRLGEPVRPAFNSFFGYRLNTINKNVLITGDGDETALTNAKKVIVKNTVRTKRESRNMDISLLRASEAQFCTEPGAIKSYRRGVHYPFSQASYDLIGRQDAERKPHHITEISAVNPGGARYVYGIAAYNKKQEEISFTNESTNSANGCVTGLADYNVDYYNKKRGQEGDAYDGYYNATTLPAFAHSYLLTAVLSPDYVDKTGDGLTEDDNGNYTKINYTMTSSGYGWRVPYEAGKANHIEGIKSDPYDNKGSITYGEKEVWLVHSIESKNYIAEFQIELRDDAVGSAGIHGGRSNFTSGRSYKLTAITLYSKEDRRKNGNNAIPVKTVHFEYNNSLCKNVGNNTGFNGTSGPGKLTLTKIYFTYGASKKGKLNTYEFTYNNSTNGNPDYDSKGYDRWGYYKKNYGCGIADENGNYHPSNAEFPYVTQNKALADQNAAAWSLVSISLPSRGKINITYESDDYAYVQNKQAMQMFMVKGFTSSGTSAATSSNNTLYNVNNVQQANNWVHVKLNQQCPDVSTFIKNYVPDPKYQGQVTRYLYFNLLTRVQRQKAPKEYVRGYAEIACDNNWVPIVNRINNYEYAIKVNAVTSEDKASSSLAPNASPFAKAAWQYFRISLPQYVYPASDMKKNPTPGLATIKSIAGFLFDIVEYVQGVNDLMLQRGFAQYVELDYSWVRLKEGTGFKYGGGVRVKRLEMTDAGNSMGISGGESSYGQEYEYTTSDNGRTISSGVASYEPMVGGDENPFRQPIVSKKENALIPDESFYSEEPMGESFFPGAGIVYSKVTVRNLARPSVTKHATGKIVNEFYTTKDFPTLVSRTNTATMVIKPNWLEAILSLRTFNQVTALQGYQIELNDMDGKPKAEWVYAENIDDPTKEGKLISGKQYFYKTDTNNPNHLNNNVKVITPDGLVNESSSVLVGVESDMVFDSRSHEDKTSSYGIQFNTDFMMPAAFILNIPVFIPSYNGSLTQFRSGVITRVVQRYGILEKTVAYADNATIATENVAYDALTGEVLLTKTQNQYNDPVYNLTYPAHWGYDGMSQAAINSGLELKADYVNASGTCTIYLGVGQIPGTYFSYGDRVLIEHPSGTYAFIWKGPLGLKIEGNQTPPPSANACNMRVIRAGRDNNPTPPIMQFVTRENPMINGYASQKTVFGFDYTKKILHAEGTEYSDSWMDYCNANYRNYGWLALFDKIQLVKTLNYLYKSSQVSLSQTIVHGTIGENTNYQTELGEYNSSFIKAASYAGEYWQVYGTDAQNSRIWTFKFAGDANPLAVALKQDVTQSTPSGCTSGLPIGVTYVSDNITYTNTRVNGEISVNLIYSNCTVPAKILLNNFNFEGIDVVNYRFMKLGEMCLNEDGLTSTERALFGNGLWKEKRKFLYLDNRLPVDNLNTNIRNDGYYASISSLFTTWAKSDGATSLMWDIQSGNPKWTWKSEITLYSPLTGGAIESRDPLGRYDAMVEERDQKPVVMASNAERREVAFDGIEYYNVSEGSLCPDRHWNFRKGTGNYLVDATVSHTGKNSIKLINQEGAYASNTYFVRGCGPNQSGYYDDKVPCTNCILPFSPYPGKQYVISGWVKVDGQQANVNNRTAPVRISFGGMPAGTLPIEILPSGPIIEGWQRFEKKFEIPVQAVTITVNLMRSGTNTTWYDDIRIFPYQGNIKTYVYNLDNQRLMAELDENNYASFYEYDEQGALKRVKKETENGIMTIKESRNHMAKPH